MIRCKNRRIDVEQNLASHAAKVRDLEDKISETTDEMQNLDDELKEMEPIRNKLLQDFNAEEQRNDRLTHKCNDYKSNIYY